MFVWFGHVLYNRYVIYWITRKEVFVYIYRLGFVTEISEPLPTKLTYLSVIWDERSL